MHPLVASTPARPGRGDGKRAWGGNSAHAVPVLCVLPQGYISQHPCLSSRARTHGTHTPPPRGTAAQQHQKSCSTYSISTSADVRERGPQRMPAHSAAQPQIYHVNSCRRETRFGVVDTKPPMRALGRHAVRGTESLTVDLTVRSSLFAAKTIDSRHDPHVPQGDHASGGRAYGQPRRCKLTRFRRRTRPQVPTKDAVWRRGRRATRKRVWLTGGALDAESLTMRPIAVNGPFVTGNGQNT